MAMTTAAMAAPIIVFLESSMTIYSLGRPQENVIAAGVREIGSLFKLNFGNEIMRPETDH
jgi:hypothetical protein